MSLACLFDALLSSSNVEGSSTYAARVASAPKRQSVVRIKGSSVQSVMEAIPR